MGLEKLDFIKPGDVIASKYEVQEVLGTGGMGAVVAARHTTLDQRVAIKFLLPGATRSQSARERFLREAKAAVGIKSQHVARVLDVGTLETGAPYIVMEHLEGADLRQTVNSHGPISVEVAADWLIQACEAVAEAHALGIVHRDLKPANLFVTSHADGSPLIKVLDFGISKAPQRDSNVDLTKTESLLGSPAYMSPEQIRNAKQVDARSDIWAIGVILYEIVSGTTPFDADTVPALGAKICMDEPAPLSQVRPEVPAEFSKIVHRCLDKDPAKRFATVSELARALATFAPAGSRALVDRIGRLAGGSAIELDATIEAPPPASLAKAETEGGWGQTRQSGGRKVRAFSMGLGVIGVGLVALLGYRALSGPKTPEKETPTSTTAVSTAPTPVPPSAAPAPSPSPAAMPAPVVEAAPVAPAASETDTKKPAPAKSNTAKCPAGQTLSAGHCCQVGLVWKDGKCGLPLAAKPGF